MTSFVWKTRGNTSPAGKPRVYICAHPEDREEVLKTLAPEILDLQNVALMCCPGEEFLDAEDMKEMALVLVAVTERFLRTQGGAREEYRRALELRIPTLPLLLEQDQVELFNEVCGERHVLDPFSKDETALSFREKLGKFLEQILYGEELRSKIRSVFPRRIFLSYRKKDRKYAKALMKAIHGCPGYENASVWYDEYLIPGEDFNQEIRQALQDSHLFLLMVTPQVLEKGNYVLTAEYPMAKDLLPVLAVEMETTERDAFRKHFKPLTDFVQPHGLGTALAEKLGTCEGDPEDPEREFLTGLGYLLGVEVEVDRDRALARIQSAARRGSFNAMNHLATMYRHGFLVERSLEKERELRQELLDRVRPFGDERTIRAAVDYAECLWEQGAYPMAEVAYREALQLSRDQKARWEELACLGRLGDIALKNGDLAGAQNLYRRRMEASKALSMRTGEDRAQGEVAMSCVRLAELLMQQRYSPEAGDYLEESISLLRTLAKGKTAPTARRELAVALGNLGDLIRAEDPDRGLELYHESAALLQELAEEWRDPKFTGDLAVTWEHIADLWTEQGDVEQTLAALRQSKKLRQELPESARTSGVCRGLVCVLSREGMALRKLKSFKEARQCYEQCISMTEKLIRECQDQGLQVLLLKHYVSMADLAIDMEDWPQVEYWMEKLRTGLAESGDLKHRADWMEVRWDHQERIAYLAHLKKDADGAWEGYRRAMSSGEKVLKVADTPMNRVRLAQNCVNLAQYMEGSALYLRGSELLTSVRTRDGRRLLLECGDKLWEMAPGSPVVCHVWSACLEAVRQQMDSDVETWRDSLAEWLYRCGTAKMEQEKPQEAAVYFAEYVQVNRERGDPWAVAEGYELLTGALEEAGFPDEALARAREGLRVDRQLLQENPGRALGGILMTLFRCAGLCGVLSFDEEALGYCRELVRLLEGRSGCGRVQKQLVSFCKEQHDRCVAAGHPATGVKFLEVAEELLSVLEKPLKQGRIADNMRDYGELAMFAADILEDHGYLRRARNLFAELRGRYPDHQDLAVYLISIEWYMRRIGAEES